MRIVIVEFLPTVTFDALFRGLSVGFLLNFCRFCFQPRARKEILIKHASGPSQTNNKLAMWENWSLFVFGIRGRLELCHIFMRFDSIVPAALVRFSMLAKGGDQGSHGSYFHN
jgi:hypothetical protein